MICAGVGDGGRCRRQSAVGYAVKELAAEVNVSPPRIVQLKREIAADARQHWGESVLQDAGAKPAWRREQEQRR